MTAHLHTLILAAGASTRLGHPKQLVRIGDETLLQRVVSAATAVSGGEAVSVVLGAHAAQLTPLLKNSSASVVLNRNWEEGIAASIRCGIASLGSGVDAVMIVLGDQYALTRSDLKRLIDAWQGQETLAASSYNGQLGVPAIFPRWCFSELMELRGDQGAKILIRRYSSRALTVPMPNAVKDADREEDLQRLAKERGQQ